MNSESTTAHERVAVIVPRRRDFGQRDRTWAWNRRRWEAEFLDPIEGFHDDGPFSVSIANNAAAEKARDVVPDLDTLVIIGSDWLPFDFRQVEEAVRLSRASGELVFAHDQTVLFTEGATEDFLQGEEIRYDSGSIEGGIVHSNTYAGIVVVPLGLWDAVGGFDERFIGWGWEDHAFWSACNALGGGHLRVVGLLGHLWHPRSRAENEEQPFHAQNQVLGERYLAAKHDRNAMTSILSEPGGPLA